SGIVGSQLRWSPATYLDDPFSPNPIATPDQDITYTLTVTPDGQPECAATDSIRVHVLQGFELLNPDTAICLGEAVQMRLFGDRRYQYSWSPTTNLSDSLS